MTPGTQQHQSPPSEILQQKLAEQEKIAQVSNCFQNDRKGTEAIDIRSRTYEPSIS